MSNRKNMLI